MSSIEEKMHFLENQMWNSTQILHQLGQRLENIEVLCSGLDNSGQTMELDGSVAYSENSVPEHVSQSPLTSQKARLYNKMIKMSEELNALLPAMRNALKSKKIAMENIGTMGVPDDAEKQCSMKDGNNNTESTIAVPSGSRKTFADVVKIRDDNRMNPAELEKNKGNLERMKCENSSHTTVVVKSPNKLPQGNWDMDDFKRFFATHDIKKSVPYLWGKFDPENYSIWLCEYKYNNELSKVFMSRNRIHGMLQRLESMRDYAFACVCLFGDKNYNNSISGFWIWRGQQLLFKLNPNWDVDYDTYNWTKLNPTSEVTKNLVQLYLSQKKTDHQSRKISMMEIFK